ncbi:MAG: hypothetical protein ACLS6G_13540 [Christensenellales bacterium]
MENALKRKDEKRVGELLGGAELAAYDLPQKPNRAHALNIACAMLERIDGQSGSVPGTRRSGACPAGRRGRRAARYAVAERHLNEALPDWPVAFEHALVNHMFFEQFPFQDRDEGFAMSSSRLRGIYRAARALRLARWRGRANRPCLWTMAATFRFIDHTAFDRYGAPAQTLGCADEAGLAELVTL